VRRRGGMGEVGEESGGEERGWGKGMRGIGFFSVQLLPTDHEAACQSALPHREVD